MSKEKSVLDEVSINVFAINGFGRKVNSLYAVAMPDVLSEKGTIFVFRSYPEYMTALRLASADHRIGIPRHFTHYHYRKIEFSSFDDAVRALVLGQLAEI